MFYSKINNTKNWNKNQRLAKQKYFNKQFKALLDTLRHSQVEDNTCADSELSNFIPRDYKSFVDYYHYVIKRKDIKNSILPSANEPEKVEDNMK